MPLKLSHAVLPAKTHNFLSHTSMKLFKSATFRLPQADESPDDENPKRLSSDNPLHKPPARPTRPTSSASATQINRMHFSLASSEKSCFTSRLLDTEEVNILRSVATYLKSESLKRPKKKRATRASVFPFTGESTCDIFDYLVQLACGINLRRATPEGAYSVGTRAVVMSLVYIDRVFTSNKGFHVDQHNVHRLVACAAFVAHKFVEDSAISMRSFSKIAGLPKDEIASLERKLCSLIEFKLFVDDATFEEYFATFGACPRV